MSAAALWGTVGAAQALSAYTGSPIGLATARIGLTGVALAMVAGVVHGRSLWRVLMRPGARRFLLLGAAAMGLYQASFLTALHQAGVALGALLSAGSAPLFAGLLAAFGGQRPTRRWLSATAVAVAGLVVLATPGGGARVATLGVAAGLLAGASFATYTWCSRRLLDAGVPSAPLLAWLFLAGAVLILPFARHDTVGWLTDPGGLAVVGYLVVVATVVPYALWIRGMATTAPAAAATLTLTEPLTAAVVGVLALGEALTLRLGAGATLLGVGLVLTVTASGGRRLSRHQAATTRGRRRLSRD